MLKLILHHTYKLGGEAIDISYNENHGFRTSVAFQPNGMSPSSGALVFNSADSRVRVANKPIWQIPRAVKIETWIKLSALGQRRNLVEGDMSFAFFIDPAGVLVGTVFDPGHKTPAPPGGNPSWPGVDSDVRYAPDHVRRTVPLNVWTKLTYVHDGIATMRLYIDDVLVGAKYDMGASVPSVGATGVHIGNSPGGDFYAFSGEIDDLKIWKYDPDVAYKQFFARPMGPHEMDCWREAFDKIAELLADPQQSQKFIGLMRCLSELDDDFVRAIRSKGEDAIRRNHDFSQRYLELWSGGQINGPEMEQLMRNWQRWILHMVGQEYMLWYRHHVESCIKEFGGEQFLHKIGDNISLCDPAFARYLQSLFNVWQPVLEL